jgi:hypothetical protein
LRDVVTGFLWIGHVRVSCPADGVTV